MRTLFWNYRGRGPLIGCVLDLGCGDGYLSNIIADKVPEGRVLGLDKSKAMIDFAKDKYSGRANKNLKFVLEDIESVNYSTQFDLIVAFSCLHWVKNIGCVFLKLKNMLNKGGGFKAVLYPECKYQAMAIDKGISDKNWAGYFRGFVNPHCFYEDAFLKNELDRVGFSFSKVTLTNNSYFTFSDIATLAGFINGWLPHLAVLPESKKHYFLKEVTTEYAKIHGYSGYGSIRIPLRKIDIDARL